MKNSIFIIEHLEPRLWKWCLYEYKNISKIVGKDRLWFTNVKRNGKMLKKYGRVFKKSVKEMNLKNSCVLDPEANKTLTTSESRKFRYFIFGGILGDNPPKKRTREELSIYIPYATIRNIGKEQMASDNAVFVVKEILNEKKLKNLNFKDSLEIKINKIESVILPYRYVLINKKPFISKEIINYLKKKKGF